MRERGVIRPTASEIKHDGYRLMARMEDCRLRLFSRRGHERSDRFPRIGEAIDGEAVVLCPKTGLSLFDELCSGRDGRERQRPQCRGGCQRPRLARRDCYRPRFSHRPGALSLEGEETSRSFPGGLGSGQLSPALPRAQSDKHQTISKVQGHRRRASNESGAWSSTMIGIALERSKSPQ